MVISLSNSVKTILRELSFSTINGNTCHYAVLDENRRCREQAQNIYVRPVVPNSPASTLDQGSDKVVIAIDQMSISRNNNNS